MSIKIVEDKEEGQRMSERMGGKSENNPHRAATATAAESHKFE